MTATTINPYIASVLRAGRRIEIWRESQAGIGRWEILLENQGNTYGGIGEVLAEIFPQNVADLKIDGTSMMGGYVDDVLPFVSEPSAVYRNILKVKGRDFGQDLANLMLTKDYIKTEGYGQHWDNVFYDALVQTGAEITCPDAGSWGEPIAYKFDDTYLLDGFKELAKLCATVISGNTVYGADFYVEDVNKYLKLFPLASAVDCGVTLKAIAGASDNNILALTEIGEKVGFDIRNYIKVKAGDVNDHWTEGNAADYTYDGQIQSLVDDATVKILNGASLKATIIDDTVDYWCKFWLQFPMYNHDSLDFSEIGSETLTAWLRHDFAGSVGALRMYAKDDDGHEIRYHFDSMSGNVWHKKTFPVGYDTEISVSDDVNKWNYVVGSSGFTWNLTRIGAGWTKAGDVSPETYTMWLDGLAIPGIQTLGVAEDSGGGSSQALYRKRMIPISRNDVASQIELDNISTAELAHRKDPTYRLNVTSTFQSDCHYAGQLITVKAPSSGIGTIDTGVTYRIVGLHHVAAPGEDLLRGHDAITEYDLVKADQTVDPLRLRLTQNPIGTLLQRHVDRIRAMEQGR